MLADIKYKGGFTSRIAVQVCGQKQAWVNSRKQMRNKTINITPGKQAQQRMETDARLRKFPILKPDLKYYAIVVIRAKYRGQSIVFWRSRTRIGVWGQVGSHVTSQRVLGVWVQLSIVVGWLCGSQMISQRNPTRHLADAWQQHYTLIIIIMSLTWLRNAALRSGISELFLCNHLWRLK